jgi:hypothetical protein
MLLIGAAVLAVLWWRATRASEVDIHSIVADPVKFEHQNITLVGVVTDVKETTSRAGNDYATFKLEGPSGGSLTIFMWGHPALRIGERVRVDGVFETEHHQGQFTFYNEVEATGVTPSP